MGISRWKYRCFIVAKEADAPAINAAIMAAALDPDGGDLTLTVGLSATGSEPATHRWCCSSLTDAGVQGLLRLAPSFPLAKGYVWAADGRNAELDAMFADVPNVAVGEANRSQVLADSGLQTIQPAV